MLLKKTVFWVTLAGSVLMSSRTFANPNTLLVKVSGFELGKGQVIVSLFNSKDNFLKEPLIVETKPVAEDAVLKIDFGTLAPGQYAVSAVYDEDGDGVLDTNFLGIPTELVGVSNNAKSLFGPPSYKDASFELNESKTILIQLGRASD